MLLHYSATVLLHGYNPTVQLYRYHYCYYFASTPTIPTPTTPRPLTTISFISAITTCYYCSATATTTTTMNSTISY